MAPQQKRNLTRTSRKSSRAKQLAPSRTIAKRGGGTTRSAVPATTYSQIPAAIGAVSRGTTPQIVHSLDGCRVIGEDYVNYVSPLSSANSNWATVGGFPLCPYSIGSNTLADMCRNYAEWKFDRVAILFVPAVGTIANGQVAIYRKPNRADPHLSPKSPTFFPYVLNQRTGAIGPVWQPLAIELATSKEWRTSVPLEGVDLNGESDGEIFIATNNNVAIGVSPSIGLIKIMYSCTFRSLTRNPRSALIPLANQIYFNISVGQNGLLATIHDTAIFDIFALDQSGAQSSLPPGAALGNVYKFVVDSGRSSYGAANTTNLLELFFKQAQPVTIDEGFTMYLVQNTNGTGSDTFSAFPTFTQAMAYNTTTGSFRWGRTTASLVFNLVGMMSLVGNYYSFLNTDL